MRPFAMFPEDDTSTEVQTLSSRTRGKFVGDCNRNDFGFRSARSGLPADQNHFAPPFGLCDTLDRWENMLQSTKNCVPQRPKTISQE